MKFEDMINKVVWGDSYELIKNIPDNSIDLVYCDPPYEIGTGGMTGLFKNRNHKNGGVYMQEILDKNFALGFDMKILNEFVRVLKYINCYIWCNKEQILDYLKFFVEEHNCNFEIIIWKKTTFPPFTCGHFCKDKEICLYFWEKGKQKISGSWENLKTVVEYPINMEDKKMFKHPTIKPLDEVKRRIMTSTKENDIVLDCFCGSGTTCVACKETGRRYIGMEIDKTYWEIANKRINGITANGQISMMFDDNGKPLN